MHDAPVPLVELPVNQGIQRYGLENETEVLTGGVKEEERAHISTPIASRAGSYLSR
jgi:hypothetical protein